MGLSNDTLARPSPVHIDAKVPDPVVTSVVGRKGSFRGFSASSLSSLALGRGQNGSKRNSAGMARKSVNFIMSSFKEQDSVSTLSDSSRPPSLMTDDGSNATSLSSRSPSPEPARSKSRLELAFHNYTLSNSNKILTTILLPTLVQARRDVETTPPKTTVSTKTNLTVTTCSPSSSSMDGYLLEESDINVLFKWWNHLLLLSTPCNETFRAIYAIASHPCLRSTIFWNAHFELTLSTTLCLPTTVLPSSMFAKLIALGYIYHEPTGQLLGSLFTDPTKINSAEPWIKRAKNVEALVETIKHVYKLAPQHDDGGIIEARLQELLGKVINHSNYPNPRLFGLTRLFGTPTGTFAEKLENCLERIAVRIGVFDFANAFFLLDVLSCVPLRRIDFWLIVIERMIETENHAIQIRVFSFLYNAWSIFGIHSGTLDLLIRPVRWEYFFTHWSGIVRDHFMRLIAYKVCLDSPSVVKTLLIRSFETSLLENCQLRDCLPSNPIPNKRFAIRPVSNKAHPYRPALRRPAPRDRLSEEQGRVNMTAGRVESEPVVNLAKKRLGFLRGLWSEEHKDETHIEARPMPIYKASSLSRGTTIACSSVISEDCEDDDDEPSASSMPQVQKFRFIAEYVGKQWSLTTDSDAICFLDTVMDAARYGRLPLYAHTASPDNADVAEGEYIAFVMGEGRKQLWTRSLSEWSVLLDDAERFWRTCGARPPATMNGLRFMHSPDLEVEFPRWFVQRSTQIAGDGVKES